MHELVRQWYQAGSLLVQVGFLMAAIWSVRAILKSVRASQEQMGALLRLTLSGVHSEGEARTGVRPTPYLLDGWPQSVPAASQATAEGSNRKSRAGMVTGLLGWLQQPMMSSGIGPWRRMVRWLQAPAGS